MARGLEEWSHIMAVEPVEDKTIPLIGPVTLYEVGAVREVLASALADGGPVRIDLRDSGPWDVAGLQLLISCIKTGRSRDQVVRLMNPPRGCAELAERSGLGEWLQSVAG
jgi:ABC-type transporter Mla MlaB component